MANPFDTQNPFDTGKVASPAPTVDPGYDASILGHITNFFEAVPQSTYDVGKSLVQGLFRIPAEFGISAAQAGLGIADSVLGTNYLEKGTQPTDSTGMSYLLGAEPLHGYAPQIEQLSKSIASSPFAQRTGIDKASFPLAFAGIVGGNAINFDTGGGQENVIKTLVKETDHTAIIKILKDAGVAKDIAERVAPHIAETSDPNAIRATLDAVHGLQSVHEATNPAQPLVDMIREQFPDVPTSLASDIAERAKALPEQTPSAFETFVQKELDTYAAQAAKAAKEAVGTRAAVPLEEAAAAAAKAAESAPRDAAQRDIAQAAQTAQERATTGISPAVEPALARTAEDQAAKSSAGEIGSQAASVDSQVSLGKGTSPEPVMRQTPLGNLVVSSPSQSTRITSPDSLSFNNFSAIHDYISAKRQAALGVVDSFKSDMERIFNAPAEVRVKSPESMATKIQHELKRGRNPDEIRDITAGRVVVQPNDVPQALAQLYARMKVVGRRTLNYFEKPSPWGYRGINAAVELKDGTLAEVQIRTPGSMAVEDVIRPFYDKWRRSEAAPGSAEYQQMLADMKTARAKADEVWAQHGENVPTSIADRLEEAKTERDVLRDAIADHPAKSLAKARLPGTAYGDFTLEELQAKAMRTRNMRNLNLDSKATEAGYTDLKTAQDGLERYLELKAQLKDVEKTIPTLERGAKNFDRVNAEPVPAPKRVVQSSVGEGTQAPLPEEGAPKRIIDRTIKAPEVQLPPSVGDIIADGKRFPIEQTPAHAMEALAKGTDEKSWQSLTRGYMYNWSPDKKAHFFDYLATPEFVLEKIGLGRGAEMLQDAKDSYRATLKKEFDRIAGWQQRVAGDPLAKQVIFQYLDGREKDVVRDMTPEELAVAREIRSYLQDWAARLKLPEDKQISRYITHIFERDFSGPKEEQFVDPELMSIMSDNVAKSVYDPFLQKRLGKPGYVEDVWRALDAYVKRASRKEAMDPALDKLSEMAKQLDQTTYDYVKSLSHRVNMRPTEIEQSMDSFIKQTPIGHYFTDRPTAFLSRKVRQLFYRGTLGLNFSSALRNLTQGANTYAKLGEKWTTVGYAKLFQRMIARDLGELYDQNILSDELVQDKQIGVIRKGVQQMDNVLFGMFEFAEKINRGSAYFGAKAQALAKGLPEDQAIKYAKRIVRETQFAFGSVDTPVWLNDDLVKTITQLQTYNVKQAEFLGRMIKQKDIAGLIRWTGASFAMVYSIGRLFGMTPSQIIPTIGLGGAPLTSTALSTAGLFSTDAQTHQKSVSQLHRNFMTLLPAGAQIRKTAQGATDLARGKDVTATGKFRFRVNSSDALQALLFGPSALPQAQAYYDSIGKPKTQTGNPFD